MITAECCCLFLACERRYLFIFTGVDTGPADRGSGEDLQQLQLAQQQHSSDWSRSVLASRILGNWRVSAVTRMQKLVALNLSTLIRRGARKKPADAIRADGERQLNPRLAEEDPR